jgi:hypothetical protein
VSDRQIGMKMTANISEPKQTNDSESVAWWNPLHWPAAIWVFLIVLGLMTSPFVIRAFMLAGIPDMPEPFDEVAYSTWDVPAADDAFTYYREAAALHQQIVTELRSGGRTEVREPEDSLAVLKQGWTEATEPSKQWLDLHQESLAVWRRGTEKDRGLNLLPSKLSYTTILNLIQDQRTYQRWRTRRSPSVDTRRVSLRRTYQPSWLPYPRFGWRRDSCDLITRTRSLGRTAWCDH